MMQCAKFESTSCQWYFTLSSEVILFCGKNQSCGVTYSICKITFESSGIYIYFTGEWCYYLLYIDDIAILKRIWRKWASMLKKWSTWKTTAALIPHTQLLGSHEGFNAVLSTKYPQYIDKHLSIWHTLEEVEFRCY